MAVQLVDSRFLAELSVLLQRTSVRCGVYCVLLSKRCAYEVDSRDRANNGLLDRRRSFRRNLALFTPPLNPARRRLFCCRMNSI